VSDLPVPHDLPPTNEPLRIAVRRMRWFKAAFQKYVEEAADQIGCKFEIDQAALADNFVRWLRAVDKQKPSDKAARQEYFEFAAGLMLRELTANMPLKLVSPPTRVAPDSAAAFWPQGYICTMFCLRVHAAALQQEFRSQPDVAPDIKDLRHWWSFRENAAQDASFSVGFLQMLLGNQPDWAMPGLFRSKLQQDIALE
jgi:hypothetical protein